MAYSYVTHEVVLNELEKFKNKSWDEEDILRWCQQVETIFIADPDAMWLYKEIPLDVAPNGQVLLPPNLYKLIDVFDIDSDDRIRFNRRGVVLKSLYNYKKDVVRINYIGTPINDDCLPLIKEEHLIACETYCKIQGFEEEVFYGEGSPTLYFDWKKRFDGMIQAVKGDFRDWSAQDYANMTIVMGNVIPKIGYMPLANK